MKTAPLVVSRRSMRKLRAGTAKNSVPSKRRTILAGSIAAMAAVSLSFGTAPTAKAEEFTWQNTAAGPYLWAVPASWAPAGFPNAVSDIANLNIDILGNQTITLDQAITLGILNIGDAAGQSSITIAPGTGSFVFDNGGAAVINKSGIGSDLITANLAVATGNTLSIDNDAGILTLTGVISGPAALTKTGDGLLVLRGASTYTGVTTLNGGNTLLAQTGNDTAALGASTAGNGTVVNNGATLSLGQDSFGASGAATGEPITINGNGFRNNGALRGMMGANTMSFTGPVTMGSAARIQNDMAGTLQLTNVFNVSDTLTVGGFGFVQITGITSGASDINHYGIGGFSLTGAGAGQSYSGTINSSLGEIRASTGNATPANAPYADIAALNLKDAFLRIAFGAGAGAPTAGDSPDSKFSSTAPISMRSSSISLENSAFSATATNLFDYNVVQTLGTTTIHSGFNRIGFRSADTGTVTLAFADILKPNQGTALEFYIDSLVGTALGAGSKHRILNAALEASDTNVPFVGGWAYSAGGTANQEFVKYLHVDGGGHGYTPLVAADYVVGTAPDTWTAGQNIKVSTTSPALPAGITTIQSLNIQNATGRTLSGAAGSTLVVDSGGILTSGGGHTISVPFLTAGAGSNYELYLIAINSNNITSDVTDNGVNPVSLVKLGAGTTSFLTGNSYTGTTFINEGQFRGVIGSQAVALGSGNLTFGGSPTGQATFENDGDFTRALGTGAGQVQFLGGGGVGSGSAGFSAFGAPIDVNFGGAGATVVWGSPTFNPGIFTLNGGNGTHVVTLVNDLDLAGEQRYIRLDGSGSGAERAVMGIISGDITNGSIVKRGGGILILEDAKSYQNGTLISQGTLWLRGDGTAGANVAGNDIQVGVDGLLKIESPSNIGSQQMIILQNNDVNTPAAITFGSGYGDGSAIVFNSFTATGGVMSSGGNNVFIANNQSGQARRIAVTISGLSDFQADVLGQIRAVAPNVEAWFGADSGNGVFTGATLSPSGGAVSAYRLGGHTNSGGVLTIANANVLTDTLLGAPTPLIVGAPDQTDRGYTDGTIYIPQAQSFTGQVTIGQGGILQAGVNGSLGTGGGLNDTILLRGAELRLDAAKGTYGGQAGTQYSARNLNIAGGTGTIRTTSLLGAGFNDLHINDITVDANRTVQILTLGTNFTNLVVNDIHMANSANTLTLLVGVDNSFQAGAGVLTVNGVIADQATGAQALTKSNGGVLILNGANTYDGGTTHTQGRLVLGNTSGAGTGGITISTSNSRRSDLEYRINGTGPFLFNNAVTTAGGDDFSDRFIVVGANGPGSENQLIQIPSLTIGHAGTYAVGAADNSAIFFDGYQGYRLEVTGNTVLNRSIALRPRGAVLTLSGTVSGAAANALEKNDSGTLYLNGNNTYLGTTTVSAGYLVAGSDTAFGGATSAVVYRGTANSAILASGVRTITRGFSNTATGGVQALGGLDAGAKLFTGDVAMTSRGLALSSFRGGDTTFAGVISGGFGIDKQGNGTVILDPSTGTGNTYTGTTTITQGILIGQAQATSGSPFGTGGMSILDAEVQLQGLAGGSSVTSTAGSLTVAGGARVGVNDPLANGAGTTTLNFGSLVRSGAAGTVTFVPVRGALGTEELITFSTPPPLVNTIIGPWAVHAASGTNNSAHYVTMAGTSVVTATYGGTGDLDTAAGSTQVFNAGLTGGALTADRSVFAVRTEANLNLNGFTLSVGDSATPANGGGIILNNGADITGGAGAEINIGNAALSLYVDDAGVSTLGVPVVNTRNNVNNTLATVFTKFGPGTLEIGAVQQFQGNIELNRGTLSFTAPNVLPFFSNLNGTTGSVVIMSPGTTMNLNNNDQEFGNLSAVNTSDSSVFSAGTLNIGTATLTVGREDSSHTFNGQIIGGIGSRLVKVGIGRLTLDNINGTKPNTLESVDISRGVLQTWLNDNSFATPTPNVPAIPSTTTVFLRGGEWEAYGIGDSTGNQQRIFIGNNVVHQGGDSIMDSNRPTGGGANKLMTYGNLTLDVQRFLFTGGNTYIPRFDGTVTLTNHARVQNDTQAVFAGAITDGGNGFTLNKIGNSDLAIGGDSSGSWSGGMVITGGLVFFGTRGLDDILAPGTTVVPLATANAGTGDIIVNTGSALRITAPSNILTAAGQEVRIYGSGRASTTRVELLTDAPLTSYGLRSLTDGSLTFNLSEGFWTSAIDLKTIGNGQWGIAAGSNTYYTAPTLGAGLDNVYGFNGSAGGTFSILNSNVVTGDASVEVGKTHIFAGGTPTSSQGSVRFYGDQDYTGNTTIFRGADAGSVGGILEITGDIASPVINVYGRLTVRGDGRLTDDAGAQANTVILRPGSNLRFDYNMDVTDNFLVSRLDNSNLGLETDENKWSDTTPMVLDGAGFNLISSTNRVNQEIVGAITIKGGAGITLERAGSGQIVLRTPSITRSGQATLGIRNTTVSELGSINIQSQKLFVTGAAPTLTNGIVAPWMVNLSGRNFLSYNATTGFTNAPFVTGTPAAGGGNAFLSGFTGTEVVQFAGGWGVGTTGVTTLTGTKNVYALRVDEDTTTRDAIFQGGQINIHSGGLIAGADDGNRVNFDTTAIYFGNGTTPVEGIVYGGHSSTNTRFGGVVTANNLTFDGPGGFHLTNAANAITGTIQMNGGTLFVDGSGARGTASEIILHSEYANNFNGGQMASLRLRHNSATTTYGGLTVTVAENVPVATIQAERFAGSGTATLVEIQNLNIAGTDGPAGTMVNLFNSNSNATVLGTTTIGGTSGVGINVNTATWRLIGNITSAAPIVKTGGGVLRWDGVQTGFTGGFTLNAGEWRLNGTGLDKGGTGDVELNFGVVRMAATAATAYFTAPNQDVSVNGQVTFITDRDGGGSTARTIGANGGGNIFRTTNSPYLIFQSATFGDDIVMENRVIIDDSPTFRTDSADLFLRDVVSGQGTLNKAGIFNLHFDNNAANTWTGGFNNFTGLTFVRQTNATLGTGPVQVFAGTGLSIGSVAQLGTTGLTNIFTSGTALPSIGTRTIANFNAITAATAAAVRGTGNGVLALDANQTLTTDPQMAVRDGGAFSMWNLGSLEGNGNLTANSVTPWGAGGTEFRLGGGSSSITVGPATAGSDQFAGAANKLLVGVQDAVLGWGNVTFNANGNNSFGGGTLVARSRNVDGGYRGTTLSVQGGAVAATTDFRTPLGTGQIDLFGDMRYEGASGTAVTTGGLTNANVIVFHPGSRLRFDNNTPFTGSGTTGARDGGTLGGGGRWADSVGIALNSSVLEMFGDASDHIANREIIGDLSVKGGSEVVLRRDTGDWVELSVGNITRNGTGTLQIATMVVSTNTAGILGTVASNVDSALLLAANGASLMNNGMVAPWIVSRFDNNFVKYDVDTDGEGADTELGFQAITQGGAPANYVPIVNAGATVLTGGGNVPLNDGTEILSATGTANFDLGSNLDVYAMRLDRDINVSANGQFDRITIRSGGLIQAANTPTINADLYFGASGLGDGEALIHSSNNTLQINGAIHASQVTKFGTAFLNIRSDQPQFTGDWAINNGGIQFLTPGSQGAGEVILNGARMNDRDSTLAQTEVRYNFNSGSPDLFTWGGGKITVNDSGIIRSVATNDRLDQIPAIDLMTSGGGQEGIVFFQADAARHTIRTGTVTLHDNFMLGVDATSFGPGSTSGVQLGSGNGAGGLNNQGLYDVRLSGDGILSLGDNSASFTGTHTFTVGDGTVRVMHNGAFGSSDVTATLRSTSVMEIAAANFQPTANVVQEIGSIERWARSDARGTGNYSLPSGVHLQVFTDIVGTRTIDLSGGSIMGYLPLDYDQQAVIQTIRSGVTVNLTADSFLGQIYPAGTSNGANHFIYDMGKLNTTTNLNRSDVGLRGSYLVIDGNITGNFDLTKVGQDVIKLAGANAFGDLNIDGGLIQIGRDNALAATTVVRTRGEGTAGILDLNGYNQTIAGLEGAGGSVNNSGFDYNTLGLNTTADHSYAGSVNGSVDLVKQGAAVQTLTGENAYVGTTTVQAGELHVAIGGTLTQTSAVQIDAGALLRVNGAILSDAAASVDGTLMGSGSVAGNVAVNDGGTLAPGSSQPGTLAIGGNLALASNSTFAVELGGTAPGDGPNFYDQANVAGTISLDSDAEITLAITTGFDPVGTNFFVLTQGGVTPFASTFANAPEGGFIDFGNGISANITYLANWNGMQATSTLTGGNDVALFNVIPEPGSFISLLGGMATLLGLQRFRRRRS